MASTSKKTTVADKVQKALAATRIGIGFVFLWAFLDKTFGFNFSTPPERSWLNGGSPTTGFLSSVDGWFADMFAGLAGVVIIDWLFMLGLLGVGVALILGAGVRIATVSGSVMLFLMWLAALPLATNPLIDDHIIYILALAAVGYSVPTQAWSIAGWWRNIGTVKSSPWLW